MRRIYEVSKVVGTNRNRKILLKEGWKHYWYVFFPGNGDWRADLENGLRRRLYFPGEPYAFSSATDLDRQAPPWAGELDVSVHDQSVAFRFRETDIGSVPLFARQNHLVLSNWANSNPFERAGVTRFLSERDRVKCRDFVIAAVCECGNAVLNRMLLVLKEAEHPKFEIYCRPTDDVFAPEKKLPEFGLSKIHGIDLLQNELTNRIGISKYSYVQIKLRAPSTSKAGPRGSFREQDDVLVEKMKSLIDEGTVPSVRQAAFAVVAEAPRRKTKKSATECDDSVVRRLQGKFSKTYPNYINPRKKTLRTPSR